MSYHVTFYNYIIDDVNSKDYDKNLPFGGIRKDTPVLHKKRYEEFCKEYEASVERLVRNGETKEEAERIANRYVAWKKKQILGNG